MYRKALTDLIAWKKRKHPKPLVIRGARQVGKTWLVREFAQHHFTHLIEINFDKTPNKAQLFTDTHINRCLQFLEIDSGSKIIPGKTLLFFDEIQAAPALLPLLRYFYEDRPDIHIIATGSLLEFLLTEHDFSMPVGRIEYLHLGPMNMEEFLLALQQAKLVYFLENFSLHDQIPASIHDNLLHYLKLFWVIGGMPAAVSIYCESGTIQEAAREHEAILQTYEDDFSKYRKRIYPQRLQKVFRKIPALLGNKLKYVKLDPKEKSRELADTLQLLELAKIIYRVQHSAGNGVPLSAEAKEKDFKALFLDVGLVSSSLGLNLSGLQMMDDLLMVNNGAIAEQFIGQHLLYNGLSYKKPQLFYWNREKRNSSAEVDYLISVHDKVIPVEVKAGKTGSLKSLQIFLAEKRKSIALRFNTAPPFCTTQKTSIAGQQEQAYQFISLPLYLVCQTTRLLTDS